jgi:hypothetical protein
MGAMATVVVPWFADCYRDGSDWRALAWWIHDHLPYSQLQFFPKLAAFNIGWHEQPRRRIDSFIAPKGLPDATGNDQPQWFARRILSQLPGCEKGKRLKWQGARVPSRRCGRSTICLITPALAGAVNWSSSGSQRLAPLRLADQDREGEQSLYRIGREGRAGWRGGGGASLTAFGAELLERYNRILDRAATNAVDDLAALARRAHPDAGVAQRTRSSRRDAVRRDYSRPCPLRQDVPFLAPD